jgi:hypothetical protein
VGRVYHRDDLWTRNQLVVAGVLLALPPRSEGLIMPDSAVSFELAAGPVPMTVTNPDGDDYYFGRCIHDQLTCVDAGRCVYSRQLLHAALISELPASFDDPVK